MASCVSGRAFSRRFFLRRAALTSASLALLAACGPQAGGVPASPAQTAPPVSGAPPAASQPKPTEAAGAPERGGGLRVGLIVDAATLHPPLSGSKGGRQSYPKPYDPPFLPHPKLPSH